MKWKTVTGGTIVLIIILKEGAEGDKPIQFFETWLPDILGLGNSTMQVDHTSKLIAHTGASGRGVHAPDL